MNYMNIPAAATARDEREMLLEQIMANSFAALDLKLYLNTHPNDKRALAKFKEFTAKAMELREKFESRYYPLTASANAKKDTWMWIENPYPWDKKR